MDKPNSPDAARPAPYAAGTGTAPLTPDPQALARMSYRELLALKHSDPETYARLRSDR